MPKEFEGLLDLPRKMFDCKNSPEAVKEIVEREVKRMRGEQALLNKQSEIAGGVNGLSI